MLPSNHWFLLKEFNISDCSQATRIHDFSKGLVDLEMQMAGYYGNAPSSQLTLVTVAMLGKCLR